MDLSHTNYSLIYIPKLDNSNTKQNSLVKFKMKTGPQKHLKPYARVNQAKYNHIQNYSATTQPD